MEYSSDQWEISANVNQIDAPVISYILKLLYLLQPIYIYPMILLYLLLFLPKYSNNTFELYHVIISKKLNSDESITVIESDIYKNKVWIEVASAKKHGYIKANKKDAIKYTHSASYIKENSSDTFTTCGFCKTTDSQYRIGIYRKSTSNVAHSTAVCSDCAERVHSELKESIIEHRGSSQVLAESI